MSPFSCLRSAPAEVGNVITLYHLGVSFGLTDMPSSKLLFTKKNICCPFTVLESSCNAEMLYENLYFAYRLSNKYGWIWVSLISLNCQIFQKTVFWGL